jgi:hypothetical protein
VIKSMFFKIYWRDYEPALNSRAYWLHIVNQREITAMPNQNPN